MNLSSDLYKQIAEEIFVGVLIFDAPSGICFFANKMAREILSIPENEDIHLPGLFPEETKEGQRNFNAELIELTGIFQDVILRRFDGTNLVSNLGIKDLGEGSLLLMIQDITIRKKLQREVMTKQAEILKVAEELRTQNNQLLELDRAKDRFVALTSHELRTPVSAIVATAEYVSEGHCTDPAEIADHVKTILEEGRHLLSIVNDILDLSKVIAGKMEFYIERDDLVAILKKCAKNNTKFANSKKIKVDVITKIPQAQAYYDPQRMIQIIDNILSNAIKFNKEGGQVTIDLKAGSDGKSLLVSVTDTGAGIPAEFKDKVFNEFETVENMRTHHKGTGLGMPICKRLVEGMGGKVYFESQVGQGTTFFVEVPTTKILSEELYRTRKDDLAAA